MRLPVELLAPAGSPEAAKAAVQNGADAIYLGGKEFSARQFADNFGQEELLEILSYCRVYGVKVYVTVNTLMHNEEMKGALEYLRFLYNAGVDAVIMQDIGLIRCARELIPDLTIHASTQMTLHNSPGISFLEELGIKRVVLAREMSLEDIKQVKQKTGMELEVFVHGALCIAYSGQCLFSSMIGGRSGNRGRCAQPCRLPYSLQSMTGKANDEGEQSHLFSPKDLNLLEHLPRLLEAGVSGLKIEGRMKRPEYVAVVVKVYRQALDRYAEDPENYSVSPEELQDLAQVFNREFTTGYLFGNPGQDLMSLDRPNNRGIFLGRVQKIEWEKGQILIRTDAGLRVGDEIEFWITSGGRREIKVDQLFEKNQKVEAVAPGGQAQIKLQSVKGIHPGDRVFKTYDVQLMSQAKQSFTSPAQMRKIPIRLKVELHPGEPMVLTGEDDLGNRIIVKSEVLAEQAIKRPLTEETINQQLDRLGNTPFRVAQVDFDLGEEVILPVSELNKCRRKLVELLEEKRSQVEVERLSPEEFKVSLREVLNTSCPAPGGKKRDFQPIITVSVGDGESAEAAIEAGARRVYLGGERFKGRNLSRGDIEALVRLGNKSGTEVFIGLPRIWEESELDNIKKTIEDTLGTRPSGYSVGNFGSLQLLNSSGAEKLHIDYPLNIFNRQAACFFLDRGAASFSLSMELNLQEICEFGDLLKDAECVVHGWPPVMISKHCVLSTKDNKGHGTCLQGCSKPTGLKDRMNLVFPVRMDALCRMYVFNSKELCLIENLNELIAMGVGYFRIEAQLEKASGVERIVSAYTRLLQLACAGMKTKEEAVLAREQLEKASPQGITKGHYFRGV